MWRSIELRCQTCVLPKETCRSLRRGNGLKIGDKPPTKHRGEPLVSVSDARQSDRVGEAMNAVALKQKRSDESGSCSGPRVVAGEARPRDSGPSRFAHNPVPIPRLNTGVLRCLLRSIPTVYRLEVSLFRRSAGSTPFQSNNTPRGHVPTSLAAQS